MLHNQSDWDATLIPGFAANGDKIQSLVLKQSFEFNTKGEVFFKSVADPLIAVDEHSGEPEKTGLCSAAETAPFKQGFEFYGHFTAYPPKNKVARVVEVGLKLIPGPPDETKHIEKKLRVTGKRHWKSSLLGLVASDPEILTPTAIEYTAAFGGVDAIKPELSCTENPVGSGFRLKSRNAKLQTLPQIELATHFIKRPGKPVPVGGFGPLPLFWSPRIDQQPELDQDQLMAGEFPFKSDLPLDYYNTAPRDQRVNKKLSAGWQFAIAGLLPELNYSDYVNIPLPYLPPKVVWFKNEQQQKIAMQCDTLVVDGDKQEFSLIWRAELLANELGVNPEFSIVAAKDEALNQSLNQEAGIC